MSPKDITKSADGHEIKNKMDIPFANAGSPTFLLLCSFVINMLTESVVGDWTMPKIGLLLATLFATTMYSVWLAIVLTLPIVLVLLLSAYLGLSLINNRQAAFVEAKTILSERIREGRAERRVKYDIYLPSAPSGLVQAEVGLLFIPGALVEHTAYARIAAKLSDLGILVVVLAFEPTRLPGRTTGADKETILKIMYEILSTQYCDRSINVTEWAIGGHSMGGSTAFNLVREMAPGVTKLVLCGSSSPGEKKGTIKNMKNARVLVFTASNDGLLNLAKQESVDKFYNTMVPPLEDDVSQEKNHSFTRDVRIEGGNHAGYAHYGPQLFPAKDGERTISLEEQQDQVVEATANFLLGLPSPADKSKKE